MEPTEEELIPSSEAITKSDQERRSTNTALITGDAVRDSLPKDLVTKLDKVQRCLTKFKTLSQNANEVSIRRILNEVKILNFSKYTSEVAESIAKVQLAITKDGVNTNDSFYPALLLMTEICEIMHVRYEDFQKQLVKALIKQFKTASETEDFETKTSQRKIVLFFMTELFIIGLMLEYKRIFESLQEIFNECK